MTGFADTDLQTETELFRDRLTVLVRKPVSEEDLASHAAALLNGREVAASYQPAVELTLRALLTRHAGAIHVLRNTICRKTWVTAFPAWRNCTADVSVSPRPG